MLGVYSNGKNKKKNDQVNVKTKWECPTKAIKRGESKKHDERKEGHDELRKNNDSKSIDLEILFQPMNLFLS